MSLRVEYGNNSQIQTALNGVNSQPQTTVTPFKEVLEKVVYSPKVQENENKIEKNVPKVEKTHTTKPTSDTVYVDKDGTMTTTMDDIFKRASKKYGVSYQYLVAVAKAESDFNPKCVSSAGAKGVMQLMPYEVRDLGVDDVYDPEQNIMASAKLLAAHLKKFDGDKTLAAAAYNAGSGAVKKYGGVPPYRETQNYVKKIAAYMEQGVKAPTKKIRVTPNKLSGKIVKGEAPEHKEVTEEKKVDVPQKQDVQASAVEATEKDLEEVRVVIGSGEDAVTMTYGAYLKYLELGDLGVG